MPEKKTSFKTKQIVLVAIFVLFLTKSNFATEPVKTPQWTSIEITIKSSKQYQNPYTDIDVWAWFVNGVGDSIVRPAFWDGGNTWKIRFAAPDTGQIWQWTIYTSKKDDGFTGKKGTLLSVPYTGNNPLIKHGLLHMSPGKRNIVHADGTPFLLVGDTPWSIPYRATQEQVEEYATDRQQKGFNTALLIAIQPDQDARGPELRNTAQGFMRGFFDLQDGHLNKLNPSYFKTLDSLLEILHRHQMLPVIAPLAHGYGWKGQRSLGPVVVADEYARFTKYLLARYGDKPACYLLCLDGYADEPGVVPSGETLEQWDSYQQPTGLHYNPCDDFLATWATAKDSFHCYHLNRKHQDANWLDFQWAQTGHDGLHLYHKVERMYYNKPTRASMAGEPTYEKMNKGANGLGWWQGEDAWNELMHGGTMGVVYGAVCMWQWKVTADEKGWEDWTDAPYNWHDAMHFEGSNYVGAIANAFAGFDFADMEKRWDLTENNQPLLAKEGIFYVSYLDKGGSISIKNFPVGLPYYWFDPVKGIFHGEQESATSTKFTAPNTKQPWVFIAGDRKE